MKNPEESQDISSHESKRDDFSKNFMNETIFQKYIEPLFLRLITEMEDNKN
jgi:hypothetical protein